MQIVIVGGKGGSHCRCFGKAYLSVICHRNALLCVQRVIKIEYIHTQFGEIFISWYDTLIRL
jgi:hypothetical protein